MRLTFALVLFLLPGACGGSGGGTDAPDTDDPGAMDHADRVRALDAVAGRLADLDVTTILPASGTATYAGQLGATLAPLGAAPLFVAADVSLAARFGAGTLSGTFDRVSAVEGTVSGSGAFTGGNFGPAGIDADVEGTLVLNGASHAVDGSFRGAFLGPGADGIVGAVEADLSRGGAQSGRLDGEVWVER